MEPKIINVDLDISENYSSKTESRDFKSSKQKSLPNSKLATAKIDKMIRKFKQDNFAFSDNYRTERKVKEKVDQSSSYILNWTQKYPIDNWISPQWKINTSWFSPETNNSTKTQK